MVNYGNFGTTPYKRVVLDNTSMSATDTPYPINFIGDSQTGVYYKGAGSFGFGSAGSEVASVSSSGLAVGTLLTGGSYPFEYLSSTAITAVANIDFTGLQAGYDYLFSIRNAVPAVAAALRWRVSQLGTFDTGSNYLITGANVGSNSTSGAFLGGNSVNATVSSGGADIEAVLHNPGSITEYKTVNELGWYINSTPSGAAVSSGSRYLANTTAIDGFRIFFTGQNFQAQGFIIVHRRRLS